MLVFLFIVPVTGLFSWVQYRKKRQFRISAGYGEALRSISRFSTNRNDYYVSATVTIVVFLLVLALVRPQIQVEKLLPEYEKQDLILILDRSVSMQARDVPPSRFVRAVREIKTFLSNKPEFIDRVGLVGFAGTSIVLSHLTSDLETLFFFLDWIVEDTDIYYGTNVAGAINSALELARKDTSETRKTFLLVSDGDDESTELADYLNELNDAGIKVHTIGIGTEQAVPIPVSSSDGVVEYLSDEEGNQLTTRFDESTMRLVASMTHGSFFRSTSGHDLSGPLNKVVSLERQQKGWKRNVEYLDLYGPLLLLACAAMFLLIIRA